MNRLPQVLQNEIWEYVRGDRAYWKQQFKPIVERLTRSQADGVSGFEDFPGQRLVTWLEVGDQESCQIIAHKEQYLLCVYPWISLNDANRRRMDTKVRIERDHPTYFF